MWNSQWSKVNRPSSALEGSLGMTLCSCGGGRDNGLPHFTGGTGIRGRGAAMLRTERRARTDDDAERGFRRRVTDVRIH